MDKLTSALSPLLVSMAWYGDIWNVDKKKAMLPTILEAKEKWTVDGNSL
jgi:hypothetical protein